MVAMGSRKHNTQTHMLLLRTKVALFQPEEKIKWTLRKQQIKSVRMKLKRWLAFGKRKHCPEDFLILRIRKLP